MDSKKVISELKDYVSSRISLCYFKTLEHPLEITDPIKSLLFDYSELEKLIISNLIENNNFSKFLYYNKNNIHNILFDNEEKITIDANNKGTEISFLFYLSLLIIDNPDILYYKYSFDYIKEINNIIENKNNSYSKIVIAKLLLDLIENYKNLDDFISERRIREELEQIQKRNIIIIRDNVNTLKELNLELTPDDIKLKSIDELFSDILNALIISNKFEEYDYIDNIVSHLDLKSISLTKTIYDNLVNILNTDENLINEYMIKRKEDINETKKINFYYFLLIYILKDSYYIYQIEFLSKSRKNIINILVNDSNGEFENISNERLKLVMIKLCDSEYYNNKYLKIRNYNLDKHIEINNNENIDKNIENNAILDKINDNIDYNDLKEVLQYYKNYLFESKAREIYLIEEIINNNRDYFDIYLRDKDIAKKMNKRYAIINYLLEKKHVDKNEEELNKCAKSWEIYENTITNKKIKKMRKDDKINLFKYFSDEKNKDSLLEIFKEDIYEFFKKESIDYMNKNNKESSSYKKEKINMKENIDMSKLTEVYNYYRTYLFESKLNDIKLIDNYIKNGGNINYVEYIKDLDESKKMNDRFNIINCLFSAKSKGMEKNEEEFNKYVKSWEKFEKMINDKKIKKMRNDDKNILMKYFADDNNKESLLKIFPKDSYEFFKKGSIEYIKDNKKDNIDKTKLEEINTYYKRYYFESKRNDISLIENYFQNNNRTINYELYLKDLDNAKKMNDRFNIINYLYNSKNTTNAKNEHEMNQIIQKWNKLEKMIIDKKIKKMRADDKKLLIEYFDDENNKDLLIKIFGEDSYESFKGVQKAQKDNNENVNLKEILNYYKEFLFESKHDEIILIENKIRNKDYSDEKYLNDLDIAQKRNVRLALINIIFNLRNKGKQRTEKRVQKCIESWEKLEKMIKERKIKKMRLDDKAELLTYFTEPNNKETLLRIFNQDDYEFFIYNCIEYIDELNEILKYYKDFLFESKRDDIISIENYLKYGGNINYEEYLSELEEAKKMNDRYHIINFLFNSKYIGMEKTETDFNKNVKSWESLEKMIRDKKIKKMRNDDKNILMKYFADDNNKESLLKIFLEDSYEFFKKESIEYIYKNKKENIDKTKLEEIYNYYKRFYFESKKNYFILIENYIQSGNGNINYEEYLKDLDEAKKMNDRYEIIDYLYNSNNKTNIKRENEFKQTIQKWKKLETMINDKKIKKMRNDDKKLLVKYFSDENNKDVILKIFNPEVYDFLKNEFIGKIQKRINDQDINKLNLILKYYQEFLFESKSNDINLIEQIITKNNGNYEQYMEDYNTALIMMERLPIINYIYYKKGKNPLKNEKEFNEVVVSWKKIEKMISDKKIKKMRNDDKKILIEYFNDENNQELLLRIFTKESYEFFKNQKGENRNKNIDINKLNEILNYYKQFHFDSKKEDIKLIENYKNGIGNINYNSYIKDLEIAGKMNDRFNIIDFIFKSRNKGKNNSKTEKKFNKIVNSWEKFERMINEKKIKKMRIDDKENLIEYFNDENNRESLLKIFKVDSYEFFKNHKNEILDNNDNNNIDKYSELKEILNYYNNYLFESKVEDIEIIKKIIKNDNGNYEEYLQKDLENARKWNDRFNFINFIFMNKGKDKNEKEFNEFLNSWNKYERMIKDKKIKRMRIDDKSLFMEYFNDENNEESLLKIFPKDSYEFFKNQNLKNKKNNEIKEQIEKKDIDKNENIDLKEILKYYQRYLFESKKEDIKLIENGKIKPEYLNDIEIAKKMNDRFQVIDYIYNEKYKNNKRTEQEFNINVKSWETLEKMINDKKIKKMRNDDKKILIEYFKDENNKESLLKIFKKDSYEFFTKQKLENKEKNENIDENKLNELKEVLNYYNNFFFDTKKEEIKLLKDFIEKGNDKINYDLYLKEINNARRMNNKFNIINFIFNSKNKGIQKKENEFNAIVNGWNQLEKMINDKKIRKMRNDDKKILIKYFKNENNKESLLKIFKKDSYEFFKNQKLENKDKNENIGNIDVNKLNELKEILNYYKNYLFESKIKDIKIIEEILINKNGNYEEYIKKDLENARKMNDRFNIINFILDEKKLNKNEEELNKVVKSWETYEKTIRDKKLKKMRKDDKQILIKYFSDENNKELLLKIFNKESYEFFLKENNIENNEKIEIKNKLENKDHIESKIHLEYKENIESKEQIESKELLKNNYQIEIKENMEKTENIIIKEQIEIKDKIENKDTENKNINLDALNEILNYYKRYLFETKENDIKLIENYIKDRNGKIKQEYLNDLDIAKKMNDRFHIINFIFNEKYKNINHKKTEKEFNEIVQKWENLEKPINDKKIKRIRSDDKSILIKYFNDENNKESLLKIIKKDSYEFFKSKNNENNKKKKDDNIKENKKENESIKETKDIKEIGDSKDNKDLKENKEIVIKNIEVKTANDLIEILNYYNNYLFESKIDDIRIIEEYLKKGEYRKDYYEKYIKDTEKSKKMNIIYPIIDLLYNSRNKGKNKIEEEYIKIANSWKDIEKMIVEKKIKKMRKDDKKILIDYFNDDKNKDLLLKIFNLDSYEFFKKQSNENPIKSNLEIKEVLYYYKNFLFESKKKDIELIENSIENGNTELNLDEYLKDLDIAKTMNNKYCIISHIFNSKYKETEKNENKFNEIVKCWENYEKMIKAKKFKKMRLHDKYIIFQYFNDISNKDSILNIFGKDCFKMFIDEYHN